MRVVTITSESRGLSENYIQVTTFRNRPKLRTARAVTSQWGPGKTHVILRRKDFFGIATGPLCQDHIYTPYDLQEYKVENVTCKHCINYLKIAGWL